MSIPVGGFLENSLTCNSFPLLRSTTLIQLNQLKEPDGRIEQRGAAATHTVRSQWACTTRARPGSERSFATTISLVFS